MILGAKRLHQEVKKAWRHWHEIQGIQANKSCRTHEAGWGGLREAVIKLSEGLWRNWGIRKHDDNLKKDITKESLDSAI